MGTNHTGRISAEVTGTEGEQRRSQGSRSPAIQIRWRAYLSPYSANCPQPKSVSKVRHLAGGMPVARHSIELTYLSNEFQPFPGADIPFSSLLDLSEDPRLDQSPTSDHDPVYSTVFNLLPIVLRREGVSTAEDWDRGYCGIEEKTPQISRSFQPSGQGGPQ